jgi:hydrogenase nickel incorporation protein HypA/HybF
MHEFSICQGIVDAVVEEMGKLDPAPRLVKTRVVVGALRQVVPDYLTFAYETLTKGTPAEGSALEIVPSPAGVKCRKCTWSGEMQRVGFQCGACGSLDVEVTGGADLYLDSLEVETDE